MENTSIVKYLLFLLATPIWWPVVKAMWREANRMLAEDGGVFGRLPTSRRREEVRREMLQAPESLLHEPILTEQQRASARRRMAAGDTRRGSGAQGRGDGRQGAPERQTRKPGFR